MLTEDLQPWLIEINSSPSMARTTRVTAELVDCVLEDTVKGTPALTSVYAVYVQRRRRLHGLANHPGQLSLAILCG